MNRQEVFETWKRGKRQIEVRRDFSAEVMIRIRESRRASRTWDRAFVSLNQMAVRPWVKAAVLVTGVLAGLTRIVVTIHLVLFA